MEDNNLISDLQLNDHCVFVKIVNINGLLALLSLVRGIKQMLQNYTCMIVRLLISSYNE